MDIELQTVLSRLYLELFSLELLPIELTEFPSFSIPTGSTYVFKEASVHVMVVSDGNKLYVLCGLIL